MMPQFAGAKLHLIYQITKILADFLRKIVHFVAFSPFSSPIKLHFLLKIILLDAGTHTFIYQKTSLYPPDVLLPSTIPGHLLQDMEKVYRKHHDDNH